MLAAGGFDDSAGSNRKVAGLEYWKVGHGDAPFDKKFNLTGEDLTDAIAATEAGLKALRETFIDGRTPLYALPDDNTCRLCDFAGVCRRHEWQGENQEAAQ